MAKNKPAAEAIEAMSFEDALEELKGIVERLEQGEGRLEEAITSYERGARLKRHCEAKLAEAQAKIDKITLGPNETPATEPFGAD